MLEDELKREMADFRDGASCSLAEIDRYCRGAYCLYYQGEGGSNHVLSWP
jgi:hypothetical protein